MQLLAKVQDFHMDIGYVRFDKRVFVCSHAFAHVHVLSKDECRKKENLSCTVESKFKVLVVVPYSTSYPPNCRLRKRHTKPSLLSLSILSAASLVFVHPDL